MTKNNVVLSVENLTKIYGNELNLKFHKFGRKVVGAYDVSFTVLRGEIFGFLGPNGAGKTTTMRSILDYLNINSGRITILGLDHRYDGIKIRQYISYVPGDVALYENFTGLELINYFAKYKPIDKIFLAELRTIFRADLTLKIKALSKGNRQQVALIIALASRPEFLIMDEPTSGLDPLMAASFHRVLKRLRDEGTTIFLSSHDLSEVQAVCDRVGIIKEGRIVALERIEDLKTKFVQNVNVKFSSETVPSLEDLNNVAGVVDVEMISQKQYNFKVKENINELLRYLAKFNIKRLSIEDASLEQIFLEYYK